MPTAINVSSVQTTGPLPDTTTSLGSPDIIAATAQQLIGDASKMALQLVTIAGSIVAPQVTPDFPIDDVPPAVGVPVAPTMDDIIWVAPGIPVAFTGTVDVEGLMPEPFDEAAPILVYGSPPAAFNAAVPTTPVIVTDFEDPTLVVTLPPAPDLLTITIQPFGGLNMPVFDAQEPVLVLVPPSIREYTPGSMYTSALLTTLQVSLEQRITEGGTGLAPDVENAIWERGREREARTQRDALEKLDTQMEGLGYALPPGVYMDMRVKIITETDYAERGHSREVMIKAAELEQENVKHALTTATQLEGLLINYANSVEQRLFEACKYATEAGIAIYTAQVAVYAQMVELYKSKVLIYNAQIQAELAKIEAYKTSIEAEKLKSDINTQLIAQYKVQSEIALSAIEIYKAELMGIQTKAEIEKLKVEIYGEQVKAYATQVGAYTAGVEGYRATLEAEKTKQQAYQSQVEAYKAVVEAGSAQINARIAVYRGEIDAKNAEWDGYKATVQGEQARVTSLTAINSAEADLYKAEVQGYSSLNDTLTKQWQVVIDRNSHIAETGVSAAKANAELYITSRNIMADAAKSSSTVFAQLGAAALNTMNWSNQVSRSFGNSNTYTSGDGVSMNYSYGFAEHYNHNISE